MNLPPSPPKAFLLSTLVHAADSVQAPDLADTLLKDSNGPVPGNEPGIASDPHVDATLRPKKTFGELLMEAVENPELQDVLGWTPNGKAFEIRNSRKFITETMPEQFAIRNMSSFVRKLNRWGFQRASSNLASNTAGVPRDVFQHPGFRRGEHKLCREQVKSTGEGAKKSRNYRQKMVRQLLREEGRQSSAAPASRVRSSLLPPGPTAQFRPFSGGNTQDLLSLSLGGESLRSLSQRSMGLGFSLSQASFLPSLPLSQSHVAVPRGAMFQSPMFTLGAQSQQQQQQQQSLRQQQWNLQQMDQYRREILLQNLLQEEEMLRQQEAMIRRRQMHLRSIMVNPQQNQQSLASNTSTKPSSLTRHDITNRPL